MYLFSRAESRKMSLPSFDKIQDINKNIAFVVVVLMTISSIMLFSAAGGTRPWMIKQITYFITFTAISIVVICLHPNTLFRMSYYAYFGTIAMLIYVCLFGKVAMGARRWIDLGFFKIQPSEFMKVAIILFLSRLFYELPRQNRIFHPHFLIIMISVVIPFFLIVLQPDLATAMIYTMIAGSVCFLCGLKIEFFYFIIGSTFISLPFVWQKMHHYQKERILNFLNPSRDPLGSGYNAIQSKIAVGSGGFFGKGILNGNQSQLHFLPESQTDFIFTLTCEELGLMGAMIVIFCYVAIIRYGLLVSIKSVSLFNKSIAAGSSLFFFFHAFINISMTIGVLPVAGIPLPLMSYGGSSVAISMCCIALIMHADINRLHEHIK